MSIGNTWIHIHIYVSDSFPISVTYIGSFNLIV